MIASLESFFFHEKWIQMDSIKVAAITITTTVTVRTSIEKTPRWRGSSS